MHVLRCKYFTLKSKEDEFALRCQKFTSNKYDYFRNDAGSNTLGSERASAKKGAISSGLYPAIPQPMGVTRKVSYGCCRGLFGHSYYFPIAVALSVLAHQESFFLQTDCDSLYRCQRLSYNLL